MFLSKYLALSGVCSRRKAAELIKEGAINVNGSMQTNPAYEVQQNDVVTYGDKVITVEKKVYILLNKPKGYVTTASDEFGRKMVMDLVNDANAERLYPVGRLDKDTTGLLIITNDGDLAQSLAHPSYEVSKRYNVTLDKNITKEDMQRCLEGVELEDGIASVDVITYGKSGDRNKVTVELHSGKNRIIRRLFEALGYTVVALDRVSYAGLTLKGLACGAWRYLTDQEIAMLTHYRKKGMYEE